MTNYIEFAAKIKEKYPQYKDIDDLTLAQRVVEKYPQYKEKVEFGEVKTEPKEPKKKGIDVTPSGIAKGAASNISALLRMPIYGEDFQTAKGNAEQNIRQAEQKHPVALGGLEFVNDLAAYSQIPVLRGQGIKNFLANAALQGGAVGAAESMKRGGNGIKGAAQGTALASAIQGALPPAIKGVGKGLEKAANSEFVKNNLPKVLEVLTSVPAKYSKNAIEKELSGQSILEGKFNPDTAYQPIERKIREAKNALPSDVDFGNMYYGMGEKALEGMKAIQEGAGNDIQEMLSNLSSKPEDTKYLKSAVESAIKKYARGGDINPAEIRASRDLDLVKDLLDIEGGVKPIDLHNIKELLYDIANYDTAGGIKNDSIKAVANQINNYLRHIEPKYAKPNDTFANIKNIIKGLDGQNTMGNKIKQIGSEGSALSGMDNRLKAVDDLLPKEYKFYNQAKEINQIQDEVQNIKNTVGKQYERNPRLLANRTDEAFENAINDLQDKSKINFMEDLNNARAREALENWFAGQGGGSGSAQGFANLLRTAIIGGSPTTAVLTHNPLALTGLLTVSPKFMAKGSIKNLGRISNAGKNMQSKAYDEAIKKLIPAAEKAQANMLYGGVEYNDYQN